LRYKGANPVEGGAFAFWCHWSGGVVSGLQLHRVGAFLLTARLSPAREAWR